MSPEQPLLKKVVSKGSEEKAVPKKSVIDAIGAVMGRLATSIAQRLLGGEEITVINAEKILITGNPKHYKQHYLERIRRGSPHHGPFYPRAPDAIFRRTVKGMLPFNKTKGRNALSNLTVHIGDQGMKGESAARTIRSRHTTLGETAKEIGWRE